MKNALLTCLVLPLMLSEALLHAQESEFEKLREELEEVRRRRPTCLVDDKGRPRRVIVMCNKAALYAKASADARRVDLISQFTPLFVYQFALGNKGFHEVGITPYQKSGWIAASACLPWNTNKGIRVKGARPKSIRIWDSAKGAKGNASKAVFTWDLVESYSHLASGGKVILPVLREDPTGIVFEVALAAGWAGKDERGEMPDAKEMTGLTNNMRMINLCLVVETTQSMAEFVDDLPATMTAIIEDHGKDIMIRRLSNAEERIPIIVNCALVTFRQTHHETSVTVVSRLTHNASILSRRLSGIRAAGKGLRHQPISVAIERALNSCHFPRGALNRIVLIGSHGPNDHERQRIDKVMRQARADYVQIDTVCCGCDVNNASMFRDVSRRNGGKSWKVVSSKEVAATLGNELRSRCEVLPVEIEVVEKALAEGRSVTSTARALGMTDKGVRALQQICLIPRGANVEIPAKIRTGWMRVRPGSTEFGELCVVSRRSDLAGFIAELIGALEEVRVGKNLEHNVKAIAILTRTAKGGYIVADSVELKGIRWDSSPDTTRSVKLGAKHVLLYPLRYEKRLKALMDFWRKDTARGFNEWVWVPVSLLP